MNAAAFIVQCCDIDIKAEKKNQVSIANDAAFTPQCRNIRFARKIFFEVNILNAVAFEYFEEICLKSETSMLRHPASNAATFVANSKKIKRPTPVSSSLFPYFCPTIQNLST